jgi:hypothetical protein
MAAAFLVFLLVIPIIGVLIVKKIDQPPFDRKRKTYRLDYPKDMTAEQVNAFIRSISGSLRLRKFSAAPSMATEMWGTEEGLTHYIKIPNGYEDQVKPQLRGHIRGLSLTLVEEPMRRVWAQTAEFGIVNSGHQLFIRDPAESALTLLNSFEIKEGQTMMVQIVFSPIGRKSLPQHDDTQTRDAVNDQRAKLDDINVAAVIRVGTVAPTKKEARQLLGRIRAVFKSMGDRARFVDRYTTAAGRQRGIDSAMTPLSFPMQLSARELSALLGWPFGAPQIVGLPAYRARQFPPATSILTNCLQIGQATYTGAERPLGIGWPEAMMHTQILGKTGQGKTQLMGDMGRQIMEQGFGLIAIEREGNLYQNLLDHVPSKRMDDVYLFDVSDTEHPISFNVLAQGNPYAVIDQIVALFTHKYGVSLWAEEYLEQGLRTIVASGLTLVDLPRLLMPRADEIEWADNLVRKLQDSELRRWWMMQDNRDRKQQQQRSDPALSRLQKLSTRPELRAILGQQETTLNMKEIVRDNKILLVNLKGAPEATAALVGTMLMDAAWAAVKDTPKEVPGFVMLDEFGDFMDLPTPIPSMFAQARKYGTGFIVANQDMGQLTKQVAEAVTTNALNKLIFNSNSKDAASMISEFGKGIDVEDITNLPIRNALARIQTPSGIARPASIQTLDALPRTGNAQQIIRMSRDKYSKPIREVQAEMEGRYKKPTPTGPRPSIGSLE